VSSLEKEELRCRIKGMTDEECLLTARLLPDEVLWVELQRRYLTQNEMLKAVKSAVKEE